jgi:hypothetical protein
MQKLPIMNYQGLLGLLVLVAGGSFAWFHMGGTVFEERPVRAQAEARELAAAVLDYREDTGQWPLNAGGKIDLTLLLGKRKGHQSLSRAATSGVGGGDFSGLGMTDDLPGGARSWLPEIPLDPWDQPFQLVVNETAIAVLSTGPNLKLDTDMTRLWNRPAGINPCDGDDVGIVVETDSGGGIR